MFPGVFVATDGKNGDRLKFEKSEPIFSSFNSMLAKKSPNKLL